MQGEDTWTDDSLGGNVDPKRWIEEYHLLAMGESNPQSCFVKGRS
jgi:hypothetical protein